jgi:hydroxymethylbilane synthase
MTPLRIGTRGSPLALWQADHVAGRLRAQAPARAVDIVPIQTSGDRRRDLPLAQIGGEGAFTREIQRALQAGAIDVAVHSLKDLPTVPVHGLILAAVPARGPSGDVLVSRGGCRFDALPAGATIGTSSLRRRAQALHRRPELRLADVRGNVETRLRKLEEGTLDALILAQAGLERLGLLTAITEILSPEWMLPAVGQGALGLECRADDETTRQLLGLLDDEPSRQAVTAERALLFALGGGCLVPIGALTHVVGGGLELEGAVLAPDGSRRVHGRAEGPAQSADDLGRRLAEQLLAQGARDLLNSRG